MRYEEFKEAVIREAERLGLKDYELYYTAAENTTVGAFKDEINEFSSGLEGGVCFRCLVGSQMGYASTEQMSAEEAAAVVSRAAENAEALELEEKVFLGEAGGTYEKPEVRRYELPGTEEMVRQVLESQKTAYAADPLVIDGTTSELITVAQEIALYNSRGLDLKTEGNAAIFIAAPVVSDGKEMKNCYKIKAGALTDEERAALVKEAVEDAKSRLGADAAPTGSYPVVFAPKTMASLIGAFSSVFSAEAAQKGMSMLAGKEGEKIASPLVNLWDDPFYPESLLPMPFDAEGTPTRRKAVIAEGVMETMLYNLKSAEAAGKKSTGNASKGSYASAVGTSPFTMVLEAGPFTEEELLAKAGTGVYIDNLMGMHAGLNPISGDFSLQSEGYLIEDGKKGAAVRNFTVAGNFFKLLNQIEALANEVKMPGFGGVTGFAAPAVLVTGLSIAGK